VAGSHDEADAREFAAWVEPHLPVVARFAVRIPEWGDQVLPTYTWVLNTPDPHTIPLER
jgi:hypothetical protein